LLGHLRHVRGLDSATRANRKVHLCRMIRMRTSTASGCCCGKRIGSWSTAHTGNLSKSRRVETPSDATRATCWTALKTVAKSALRRAGTPISTGTRRCIAPTVHARGDLGCHLFLQPRPAAQRQRPPQPSPGRRDVPSTQRLKPPPPGGPSGRGKVTLVESKGA